MKNCPKCFRPLEERESYDPLEPVRIGCNVCDIHAIGRDFAHARERLAALLKPLIKEPNSSGQGYSPEWSTHPLAFKVLSFGYRYSHSTPVGYMVHGVQLWSLHHTFKYGEHTVSLCKPNGADSLLWSTSTSCASGHKHTGIGAKALAEHLLRKSRRYYPQLPRPIQ